MACAHPQEWLGKLQPEWNIILRTADDQEKNIPGNSEHWKSMTVHKGV